jgi:hypothetical protein
MRLRSGGKLSVQTCKDCIYYERCDTIFDGLLSNRDNKPCGQFDNKAYYAKLPAYIGQPVWIPYVHYYRELYSEVETGKVSMLQQKVDGSWKIRVSRKGFVSDYTVADFGKYIFITEEAAEEARIRLTEEVIKKKAQGETNGL